ncbi:MAG: hypothetical protein V9G19_18030 [Tetrasphaera sp.]
MSEQNRPAPADGPTGDMWADGDEELARELVALGRDLDVAPPAADLTDRVMAAVAGLAAGERIEVRRAETEGAATVSPARRHTGSWRRRLAVAAVIGGLALVPPVRAAVLEWIRVGGVTVDRSSSPTAPNSTASVPTAGGSVGSSATAISPTGTSSAPPSDRGVRVATLAEARERVGFPIGAPAGLAEPTSIVVSHSDRVVEMRWGSGPNMVRLDVFAGSPDYGYVKSSPHVEWTEVDGHTGIWLPESHELAWIDRLGSTQTSSPRIAGPTLVWVLPQAGGEVTYRLEGVGSRAAAVRLASTVDP